MKKKVFLLFNLIYCCSFSNAQQRVDACFTLARSRVCVGEKVVATNCIVPKGTTPASGLFNFGDTDVDTSKYPNQGVPLNGDTTHIYHQAGVYRIKQRGGVKASGGIDDTVIYITVLSAQLPQFEVSLCEGYKASFIIKNNYYTKYTLEPFPGGVSQTIVPPAAGNYTYSDGQQKTATITGECGAGVSRQFTPFSNLIKPDLFKVDVVQNGTATLASISFNAIAGMKYKVLSKPYSGIFTPIDTITEHSGPGNFSYPDTGEQCYSLVAFDDCGNADTSSTICTSQPVAKAENGRNVINWTKLPYAPGTLNKFKLIRNGVSLGDFSESTLVYIDSNVTCGSTYSYQLISTLNATNAFDGNQLFSSSVNTNAIAFSSGKPQVVTGLISTVDGNQILLSWNKPLGAVANYNILKSEKGGTFMQFATSTTNAYSDNKVDVQNQQYCYKFTYIDSCKNQADLSTATCPVLLKTQKDAQEKYVSDWTNYLNGIPVSNAYTIERLDENDQVINSFTINTDTTFSEGPLPAQGPLTRYRIRTFINGNRSLISLSNVVTLKDELSVYLPTVFTPNNDGRNDVFLAYGKYFENFNMNIFNRWGELIFYSENIDIGWDGMYKGEQANQGAYVFIVHLKDKTGQEVTRKGDVMLLR